MEHAPELAATIIVTLLMLSIFATVLTLFIKVAFWFVMVGLLIFGAIGIIGSGGAGYLLMFVVGYYLCNR